jgi:serine/threonine protein kinase
MTESAKSLLAPHSYESHQLKHEPHSMQTGISGYGIQQVRSGEVKINLSFPEMRGGGGVVRQAQWNGNLVAVKKPSISGVMSDGDRRKMMKELELQAALRHPNCVSVYAVCSEPHDFFIVMEWMHGGSLSAQLAKTRDDLTRKSVSASTTSLSVRSRLSIARNVCDGLQYMHSQKFVHGDLKTLNVLLSKDKVAKLCDFGLSTIQLSSASLMTAHQGGTVAYSAPELLLIAGTRSNFATDVYALGVVLWELLTCMQPYEGCSVAQIIAHLNSKKRLTIPSPIPHGFTSEYVNMMTRCWSEDPRQRPSAAEVHRCMISLDKSTQPNERAVLFSPGHKWMNSEGIIETTILPCLARAMPSPCCSKSLCSIATGAEQHVASQAVRQLMARWKLSALEAQSIFVYTADATDHISVCPFHKAPYVSYNAILRDGTPRDISTWSDYSFLLYNAVNKLPSVSCTVYRGLNVPLVTDLPDLYGKGNFIWYRAATSTTTDKDETMKNFGEGDKGAPGTFVELRVKNAKDIQPFSLFSQECERFIPHNTLFLVVTAINAADLNSMKEFGEMPPNVDIVVLEEVLVFFINLYMMCW